MRNGGNRKIQICYNIKEAVRNSAFPCDIHHISRYSLNYKSRSEMDGIFVFKGAGFESFKFLWQEGCFDWIRVLALTGLNRFVPEYNQKRGNNQQNPSSARSDNLDSDIKTTVNKGQWTNLPVKLVSPD